MYDIIFCYEEMPNLDESVVVVWDKKVSDFHKSLGHTNECRVKFDFSDEHVFDLFRAVGGYVGLNMQMITPVIKTSNNG